MAKRAVEVPPWISLDPSSGAPYYRQLYDGMRRAILSGLPSSGARLPSTRTLATELGVPHHRGNGIRGTAGRRLP